MSPLRRGTRWRPAVALAAMACALTIATQAARADQQNPVAGDGEVASDDTGREDDDADRQDTGNPDDPWEGFNRVIFAFNDKLDIYILRPVARGWIFITPRFARIGVENFASNLRFPITFVNDILQWKWRAAGEETGRFVVNSTLGVAGFFDLAQRWGLERQNEDAGQTFGRWGIPSGPYLVLPLLGPSNPRDTVGFAVDSALAIYPFFVGTYTYITTGYAALNVINQRALADKDLQNARKASLDFYVFVRDAYKQRREALIRDETALDDDDQEGLYDFADDEDLYDDPQDDPEQEP